MHTDTWFEYNVEVIGPHGKKIPICGLCGNTGIVSTNFATAFGKRSSTKAYCICPNGRAIKKHNTKQHKWGGTSIIE